MSAPLEGIKILEFSEIIAAPFGGMCLADLGADVIKIEPKTGEPWRGMGGMGGGGDAGWFVSLNRGKRDLALDLKTPEGQAIIHRMIPSTDVLIVNYRPDTPRNLGIDYETLKPMNPRLIYVQNTAFGPKGPHAHRPGYDLVAQAYTGLMASDGKTDDADLPVAMNPPMADYATGLTIMGAVCAALYARERTGLGQKVEASLMGTALAVQGHMFMESESTRTMMAAFQERRRLAQEAGADAQAAGPGAGRRGGMRNAYYRSYNSADGIIIVACLAQALYRKFTDAIGVPDPRFQEGGAPRRGGGEEAMAAAIEFVALCEARMQEKTTAEWLEILDKAGVPAGPFQRINELREDPQVLANDMVVELDHPTMGKLKMFGPVFSMTETPTVTSRAAPTLGQHNAELLAEAGYAEDEIAALREKGIIT